MLARAARMGALAAALAVAAPASGFAASLYDGPGPRPGPDILYEPPATAPQLTNTGVWHAKPILISGASAYRRGEFLYQDFLYDDHGARGVPDPRDPKTVTNIGSPAAGVYTYPTDRAYANNAADLVELRVKPLADATAFRITVNTMRDPDLVAATIAIGDSAQPRELPHGANAHAPARLFLTVHGKTADLRRASDGSIVTPTPTASVDLERRQIQVKVPHSAWDPRRSIVRLAAGVGLWDRANDRYLTPRFSANDTQPGGSSYRNDPPAFFNVAFRYDEPWPSANSSVPARSWRDSGQAAALAAHDLSPFHADVDFGKLAGGARDDMSGQPGGVPVAGPMNRILASHFETEQGVNYKQSGCLTGPCLGQLRGRLQPYALYVPHKPAPAGGYGLTLLLHGAYANYNEFSTTRNQSQLGERGPGSVVLTPESRGPLGAYYDYPGADVFEDWADVAAHYSLDPEWAVVSGYSMGGYGTYKFAVQYPDLFAQAFPVVGDAAFTWLPPLPPSEGQESNTKRMAPSLRHVPMLIWNAAEDELVTVTGPISMVQGLDQLGYRYTFDLFTLADHVTLAANDQFQPAADWLGATKVDRDPAHVTYVVNPTMDFPDVGTVADHAYWLSGLTLRDDSGDAPLGQIDARSEGFGQADPPVGPRRISPLKLLPSGHLGRLPYTEQSRSWGAPPPAAVRDVLHLDAQNIATATVDVGRAALSCDPTLDVTTDGPLTLTLGGCGRTLTFP